MIDVSRLRVLVAVADHGSMTVAAAALSYTQPAVSRHIAALERQLGVMLVTRTTAGVGLTAAGELLVGHARPIIDRLAVAESQLAALQSGNIGTLRLGSFSSANIWLVPEVFRRYRQAGAAAGPVAVPLLPSTVCEEHLDDLRAARLHLALVTQWDVTSADHAGVELEFLLEDEMLVTLPRDHRLANRPMGLSDLGGESWIEGDHPDCLGPLETLFLQVTGEEPNVAFHCEDWTGKQGLVAAGAGITLLPSLARRDIRGDVVLKRLEDVDLRRRIYLAYPAGGKDVPNIAALIKLFTDVAAEHPGEGQRV